MNQSHKTAIKRNTLSAPSKELVKANVLQGKVLDYGCGKGNDAEFLNAEKYDPHFFPTMPEGKFDTIFCNYVLNVVEKDKEQEVIDNILSKLEKNGKAYIAVRRDIIKEGLTSKGTLQRNVTLDLPIFKENKKRYCIYILMGGN